MKWVSLSAFYIFLLLMSAVYMPVILQGKGALHWDYLFQAPEMMGRLGGIGPIIFSTIIVNTLTLIIVFIIGLPVSFNLDKNKNRRHFQFLRICNDILASTPSIVFGLFGHAFFCRWMGLGYSLLSGALTLTLMTLPFFIRLVEDSLSEVPKELKWQAQSLKISEPRFVFQILIPSVWPALITALVLSWSRAMGETAALLLTSGYSMKQVTSLLDSGRTLSVHIFDLGLNLTGANQMAFRASFTLLLMTSLFVILFRWLMKGFIRWQLLKSKI